MPLPTQVLGRYSVHRRIATGALGTVLAAVDERSGRQVAVKIFDGAEDNHASWVEELRLAARLEHPHIATCLDAGEDRESGMQVLIYAMARGGSLRRALVSRHEFDEAATCALLEQIGEALVHAHRLRVIHRDVKPENILALETMGAGPWALTDFGAGRFLPRGSAAQSIAGSRLYMAPEVLMRSSYASSDQYSLGLVGVEVLTGELPAGDLPGRFRHAHRHNRGLRGVLARMIEPDPCRRFPDMESALHALRARPLDLPPQTHLEGGRRGEVVGGKVRISEGRDGDGGSEREAEVIRGRLGRDPLFVNVDGDRTPIIAAGRRLVTVEDDALSTILISDHRLEVFAASIEHSAVWFRDGRSLAVSDLPFGAPRARAKLPARILATIAGAPRTEGAVLSPTEAILAWPGANELLSCRVEEGRIHATFFRLPWPLFRLERVNGELLGVFGDVSTSHLLSLQAPGQRVLAEADVGADAVAIVPGASGPGLEGLVPDLAAFLTDSGSVISSAGNG